MGTAKDLKSQVEALDNDEAGAVCQLAHLDKRGGASAKQKRILSFIEGPSARHRVGWLQFFLFVREHRFYAPRKFQRKSSLISITCH